MSLMAAFWIGSALFVIAIVVISGSLAIRSYADRAFEACDQIEDEFKRAEMDDIKATLVLQMEMSKHYHKDILFRASLSFIFAVIYHISCVGLSYNLPRGSAL